MKPNVQRRGVLGGLAATAFGALAGLPAWAQSAGGLQPLEDFFKAADVGNLSLSPDAKSILGIRPVGGRLNLFVIDLERGKSTTITNLRDGDVVSPRWVSNQRIMFGVQDRSRGSGEQFNTGLFAIDKDANDFKELSERGFLSTDSRLLPVTTFPYAKGVGSGPDEVLVQIWSSGGTRSLRSSNIHRLNTRTGRATLITAGGPGRVTSWVFDRKGVARIAVTGQDNGTTRIFHRASADESWQPIVEYGLDDPREMRPLAFDGQGQLYVLARVDSDFTGVYRFDLARKVIDPEAVAVLKGYDLGEAVTSDTPAGPGGPLAFDEEGQLAGVAYEAERKGVYWLDEGRAKLQSTLEATFPDRLITVQGNFKKPELPLLVTTRSDIESPRYFLFYQAQRKMVSVGESRPWLKADRMSPMEVYRYAARDGLSIPATLTVPRGAEKKNLPLVVLHYGGPWVRAITWDFDPLVQFLASRGYAVFMPAPRASTGFGWKHYRAGWKQWGLGMQDDVTDGVKDLIARGIADPKRICLAGASYGGYLTMMGLAKEPDLFRCGINWVGVTDPALMYVEWTDFAAGNSRELSLPRLLGHPDTDAEQFARTSPVKRAAEIKVPVLMAYGGSDRRVPIINGERMRDALLKNGTPVEWVVYGDEGHNFLRQDTRLDFYARMEKFLAKNLAKVQ
ncbi:MAG: S9 family peptidase [Methylibium sp.]|nr:S9 family peptidase [Methylibium sp.]